jgi:hypothetical protein
MNAVRDIDVCLIAFFSVLCCCVQAQTMDGSSAREIHPDILQSAVSCLTMNRNRQERLSSDTVEQGEKYDKGPIRWTYPEIA